MGKNEIDLLILGSLMQGSAHGYQIKQKVVETFEFRYSNISNSTIYSRLAQFEKEGFIEGKIEQQEGVPNKKVYHLTEIGFKQVKDLAATPIRFTKSISSTAVDELMVHVLYFNIITKEKRQKVIEPYYNFMKDQYEYLTKKVDKSELELDKFTLATLEYSLEMLKFHMNFYKKLMEMN